MCVGICVCTYVFVLKSKGGKHPLVFRTNYKEDRNHTNTWVEYRNLYQPVFSCSKLTIETLEQGELCSKLTIKTPERRHASFWSLLLTLNICHILF